MRRLFWGWVGLSLAVGCGGDVVDAPSLAVSGQAAADVEPDDRPPQARNLVVRHDLLELGHLADIDHHGLYIGFGGVSRNKYTVGNWGSGWGSDGLDGDVTFTRVGNTGRVYFPLSEAREVTLRFRVRAVGSRRMQVYVNGTSLTGVVLTGDQFGVYDVRVPAERTQAGENALLLRFGGTTPVGGEAVAADMASIRVIDGAATDDAGSFVAPEWDTMQAAVELGGVERRALAFRAPTTMSYYFEVPERASLVFGLGGEGGSGLQASIRITPEGGEPNEIFHANASAGWRDQSLNLAPYAGQVVRLDLIARGQGAGRVAFSTPAIMSPPLSIASRPQPIRNVVVLLIDTLRATRLRPYNPASRVQTPAFDRVAHGGVLFEQAQSAENWTKPSCASVLTGLSPMTHGATTSEARLPESAEMLSEALDSAGFATGSFIANGYVSDRFGFDQGWDSYNNFIRDGRSTEAEDVFEQAGAFIEQHRNERFFVYIQTIDPHVPYDPPAEYLARYDATDYHGPVSPRQTPDLLESAKRGRVTFSDADRRRLEALHDGEISYHDTHFGNFLQRLSALNLSDDTLLVITADHGEEFGDHGSWGHGHSIFQELIGVPLVFYMPGRIPEGRRVEHTVSTMNIAQTVMDLTGVRGMQHAEGRSLVPDLLGDVPTGPQAAFTNFQDIRRVVRAGRYKLVVRANHSAVMFDLQADPQERNERPVHELPIAGRYTRILLGQYLGAQNRAQWLQGQQEQGTALEAEQAVMDDTIREQLRALGYAN
ncbi:MAG: sulfatase [Sandaracinaceae bacterium]